MASLLPRTYRRLCWGGVAVFDYNGDGRPDIFFTNGGNVETLKKDSPKFSNRLFRNDGNGVFTDATAAAGLTGSGYDIGVAAGEYDNDGHPDLFVAGVHHSTLYHNNGDGTFTDVTVKSGLDASLNHPDPEFGPWWAITAAWVDVNNDGLLDLFVVDYLQWNYYPEPRCEFDRIGDYCHPRFFKGQPNQLFLNKGDGTFENVSREWGIRDHVGKGMGVGVADYDLDGRTAGTVCHIDYVTEYAPFFDSFLPGRCETEGPYCPGELSEPPRFLVPCYPLYQCRRILAVARLATGLRSSRRPRRWRWLDARWAVFVLRAAIQLAVRCS